MRSETGFLIIIFSLLQFAAFSQQDDTLYIKKDTITANKKISAEVHKDSVVKKLKDPGKASLYSAIIPGGGQIYNKKYWKLPIVYAAIGIPTYAYLFNKKWYKKCQYALIVTINGSTGDSLNKVDPALRPLVSNGDVNGIISDRNEFRKNEDYSILFIFLFWGLQIVDATVDAHLKDFNVSSDLSFKVKPMFVPGPNTVAGVSFVFDFHKGKTKILSLN